MEGTRSTTSRSRRGVRSLSLSGYFSLQALPGWRSVGPSNPPERFKVSGDCNRLPAVLPSPGGEANPLTDEVDVQVSVHKVGVLPLRTDLLRSGAVDAPEVVSHELVRIQPDSLGREPPEIEVQAHEVFPDCVRPPILPDEPLD